MNGLRGASPFILSDFFDYFDFAAGFFLCLSLCSLAKGLVIVFPAGGKLPSGDVSTFD